MRSRSRIRAAAILPRRPRRSPDPARRSVSPSPQRSPVSPRPRAPVLAEAAADTASSGGGGLQEVVVTARKREENLQDVPISIDVLTQKDLQHLGITGFDDYAQKMPSISFISIGPGTQIFFMRGVSDGSNPNYANTSATGFFLDDSSLSWFGVQPDLHLYDIERIEVLNGPQGTTFGAEFHGRRHPLHHQ